MARFKKFYTLTNESIKNSQEKINIYTNNFTGIRRAILIIRTIELVLKIMFIEEKLPLLI